MNKSIRFHFFACLTLALSLVLTLVAAHFANNYFEAEKEARFSEWSNHLEDSIENRMQAYIDTLTSTKALFTVNPNLTREKFGKYFHTLDVIHKYPGLLSFGFLRRVDRKQKSANEAQLHREGFHEYHITPEGDRDEYFPVTYTEPLDWIHQRMMGFDMFSEGTRREALERARDTGLPAVSGVIQLQQDLFRHKDQNAFLIFVPIYAPGAPLETVHDRRTALMGFSYNAFRATELFQNILGLQVENFLPLEVSILDGTPEHGFRLYASGDVKKMSKVPPDQSFPYQIAGRRWTLAFWRHDPIGSWLSRLAPFLVLIFGGAISFLWWALLSSMGAAAKARDFAQLAETKVLKTERERDTLSVREKKASLRFKHLADAMPQIVWICRSDGTFEYSNEKWMQFSRSVGTIDQQSWMTFLHREDRVAVLRTWRQSISTGEPFECEHRLHDPSRGQYRWFLTRALPFRGADGQIEHWFGTCTDIQEQKEIESQLKAAVSLRDEFLSIASHELKTPLTPLRLQIQLAQRMLRQPGQVDLTRLAESYATSVSQIDRLTRLIENLLDVSRIQAGRLELDLEDGDLAGLVNDVAKRFLIEKSDSVAEDSTDSRGGGPQIRVHNIDETPVWARFDRMRMEQVVTNLISNAIKYGQNQPVEIRIRTDADQAVIEVRDRGLGIDSAVQDRIFERFERAVSGNHISGLGLGLFIVRQILLAHDGNVHVQSKLGHGSIFTVEIPATSIARSAQPQPASNV